MSSIFIKNKLSMSKLYGFNIRGGELNLRGFEYRRTIICSSITLYPSIRYNSIVYTPKKKSRGIVQGYINLSASDNYTTQEIIKKFLSFEKNRRFLLNFGALSLNLFLYFSQHVRFLR
jgi:hypothetical protein